MKRRLLILGLFFVITLSLLAFGEGKTSIQDLKKEAIRVVDQKSTLLTKVSDAIWEYAEIALMEYKSSELLIETLENEGFRVEKEVAGSSLR